MDLILTCPHCFDTIIVNEKQLNCRIFRHAVYKKSLRQIPPHSSKEKCDKLVEENKVYGCAKPSKYVNGKLEICDYI